MRELIAIGLGGALGSILRFLASGWLQRSAKGVLLPVGTVGVNLVGCFVLGLLSGLAENRSVFTPAVRGFLMVGMLGGFTTFSTFGCETMSLVRDGEFMWALTNVGVQVVIGLMAAWFGYAVSMMMK